MKILFVVGSFYPRGDANTLVISNLADALQNMGVEVSILTLTYEKKDFENPRWNEVNIIYEYEPALTPIADVLHNIIKHPIKNSIIILKKTYYKILGNIGAYKYLSLSPCKVKAFIRAIKREFNNSFDLIVSSVMPIDTAWSLQKANVSAKKSLIYLMDTLWNNVTLPYKYREKRLSFEKNMFKNSLFVITTPQIALSNEREKLGLENKTVVVEFPLIRENKTIIKEKNDDIIHCVFLGMLYSDIRPPEKVVEIIGDMPKGNYSFDFFGLNQHLIIESKDYEKAKDRIKMFGQILSAEAEQKKFEANILVNIDNTDSNQVPSKLFEYISTGKRIINFYFNKNSSVLEYLSKYPNALNIYLFDDKEKNAQIVFDFISSYDGNKIEFSYVEKQFIKNTPKYVATQVLERWKLLN
ncbi:MAG: hypothetical protein IKP88_07570 [Lachnospiraceae bacterium]|nr:hypothetical protein [Lachnospiraceae bacterium]